ncbi:uncharacterized protein LOC141806276 [Halichoeres trimaculatus]|uniref:uncharacterized protein LOC141806276 n=1 Tax=Halichoeres trimaculatus TaxID=147232 RepID=UPI003D9F9342
MEDPLSDCRPLINAAVSGKLRLVRLLVEGGAQVDARNPRGETALLAACKTLRGEPAAPETLKLLSYLLRNKADPNAQDRAGRTALMYSVMERAGEQVASILLAAGADPSMEDQFGASALVYGINAQHQPTLKVLMDACQAKGRDIIIIATETGVNGSPVTRRYLNVPPSPDTSPVSCMSPSDIVLKTSPNSSEGGNIFNFRGPGKQGAVSSRRPPPPELGQTRTPTPRPRGSCQPWSQSLNQAHEGDPVWIEGRWSEDLALRSSQSLLSLTEMSSSQELPPKPGGATSSSSSCSPRRNTLPSVTLFPPLLHLPPLAVQSDVLLQVPPSKSRSLLHLPHPPSSSSSSSSSPRASVRAGFLPPLQLASSTSSLVAPPVSSCHSRQSPRRPSCVSLM